jgi:hypothetical protein
MQKEVLSLQHLQVLPMQLKEVLSAQVLPNPRVMELQPMQLMDLEVLSMQKEVLSLQHLQVLPMQLKEVLSIQVLPNPRVMELEPMQLMDLETTMEPKSWRGTSILLTRN